MDKDPIKVKVHDICMVIITVFIILAYFKGWG